MSATTSIYNTTATRTVPTICGGSGKPVTAPVKAPVVAAVLK